MFKRTTHNKIKAYLHKHTYPIIMMIGLVFISVSLVNLYIQSNRSITVIYPVYEADANLLSNIELKSTNPILVEKPKIGDIIGIIEIPALKRELQLLEGTEEAQLSLSVGHVVTSVLPGYQDNSVIAGHRGTSFRNLDQLVIGDTIIITTNYGTFTYTIHEIRIVEADDETVIVSTPQAILTLVTCYPFDFIGAAPQRYIVSAELTQSFLKTQ